MSKIASKLRDSLDIPQLLSEYGKMIDEKAGATADLQRKSECPSFSRLHQYVTCAISHDCSIIDDHISKCRRCARIVRNLKVVGCPLSDYIKKEKMDTGQRIDLFLRICSVVQALHTKNIVHRNLHPENIFIDRGGHVLVLDYGPVKDCEDDAKRLSTSDLVVSTLQYIAPEQLRGGREAMVTCKTDVYALGVILYWLLTDSFPYSVSGSQQSVLKNILENQPERPSRKKPAIKDSLAHILITALRKDPAQRYSNAGEFAHALRAVMKNGKIYR